MRIKRLFFILISFFWVILFGRTGYAGGEDWVEYLGDILTNGGPAIADDGTIYISQVIVAGEVMDSNIYAFDPDRTLKWVYNAGGIIVNSPVIGDDGKIYFSNGNYLGALFPDGSLAWYVGADCAFRGAPAIAEDGTIYIGSLGSSFYAFNSNGSPKWEFELPFGTDPGTPSIGRDGTVYFGTVIDSFDNLLYAITPDGQLKWNRDIVRAIKEPVIGYDGTIYALNAHSHLYAFTSNGVPKWDLEVVGTTSLSSPVLSPGGLIWFGASERLYAINTSGQIVWNSPWDYDDTIYSTPAIGDDGRVHFGVRNGEFYILFSDGSLDWWFQTPDLIQSCPAITNDGHFSFNDRSRLYYMGTGSNGPAKTSWPMYRCNARRTGRAKAFSINIEALKYLKLNFRKYVDPNGQLYNSLDVKLKSALKSYDKGRTNAAVHKIIAFINEVEAQLGKKISEDNARSLIGLAQRVIF